MWFLGGKLFHHMNPAGIQEYLRDVLEATQACPRLHLLFRKRLIFHSKNLILMHPWVTRARIILFIMMVMVFVMAEQILLLFYK